MSLTRSRGPEPAATSSEAVLLRPPGRVLRDDVVAQVTALAQAGSLDAGNGDVLDGWLEGLRGTRRTQILAERTERVAAAQRDVIRLEGAEVVAEQRAEATTAELQHTERMIAVLEKRIVDPAETEPGERRERRRRPRPTLDPLEGLVRTSYARAVLYVMLLCATAGDVATFYVVLATQFRDAGELVITALTTAFAVTSVGLMHAVGRTLKDLREARGGLGRPALALLVTGWLTLGGVAFAFRLDAESASAGATSAFGVPDPAADSQHALLSALLLAGLYFASGVLAFYTGFSEHQPRMSTYTALRQKLLEQHEEAARRTEALSDVRQQLARARDEIDRAGQWVDDALAATDAEVIELKELVRVEVARHLGMPEATNGLTTGRRAGGPEEPPPPSVPEPRTGDDEQEPHTGPSGSTSHHAGPLIRIPRDAFPFLAPRSANGHGSSDGTP
ncbi:hypothetical protein SAMN05660642_01765 [Geodermatophilus siccatus]|uniref:Uncharacterized protein n=1 Tax=Geodermatophilus siccatus TaxID=1137991 RepID=A0A1G9R439_9ACTN|nr:hypothetical protein [Geodermatophilus siccatus]SDM17998.1 hypothetical protein SAMN05660642_01765 [Geodermatophilus siccatus]